MLPATPAAKLPLPPVSVLSLARLSWSPKVCAPVVVTLPGVVALPSTVLPPLLVASEASAVFVPPPTDPAKVVAAVELTVRLWVWSVLSTVDEKVTALVPALSVVVAVRTTASP